MEKLRKIKDVQIELEEKWNKHKEKLDQILTITQVRIIKHRIFNKYSFPKLGVRYSQNLSSVKLLFDWSVNRISEKLDKEFADQIQLYNKIMEAREERLKK